MFEILYSPGSIVLYLWIAAAIYVHHRGVVRHKFWRQVTDHSSIMAPVNALMYMFSSVPNKPYIDPALFSELDLLKDNWETIRDEALALHAQQQIKASDKLDDAGFNSFFRTGWKRFYLKWYGSFLPSAQKLCPETVALLNQIPSIKGAMFAMLPPGATLVRHRDPYAGSIRYHMGLVTPNDDACRISVDGQWYSWRDGEVVMFDETFIHHAENNTDKNRIVLFADVARPVNNFLVRGFNWLFSRVMLGASATRNLPGDKLGLINRLFSGVYQIRKVGKRIKVWHRPTYYAIKFALFGGLIYWLFF